MEFITTLYNVTLCNMGKMRVGIVWGSLFHILLFSVSVLCPFQVLFTDPVYEEMHYMMMNDDDCYYCYYYTINYRKLFDRKLSLAVLGRHHDKHNIPAVTSNTSFMLQDVAKDFMPNFKL